MGDNAYPAPREGEDVLAYAERLWERDDSAPFSLLEEHFGLSQLEAKAIAVASVNFNERFAYGEWTRRQRRAQGREGPRIWLKKKYALDDETADAVIAGFSHGDTRALVDHLGFEGLARCRLSEEAQDALERRGLIAQESEAAPNPWLADYQSVAHIGPDPDMSPKLYAAYLSGRGVTVSVIVDRVREEFALDLAGAWDAVRRGLAEDDAALLREVALIEAQRDYPDEWSLARRVASTLGMNEENARDLVALHRDRRAAS